MRNEQAPVTLGPGEGQTIEGPVGGPLTFKVRGDQTAGALTAFENVIPPGQGPPLHSHDREGEAWYVLEGDLRFQLGDDTSDAPAGSFVFVPSGVPHCFANLGEADARILVLFTPAGMEPFFDRFSELSPEQLGPGAFAELGAPAGMKVLGPPLR